MSGFNSNTVLLAPLPSTFGTKEQHTQLQCNVVGAKLLDQCFPNFFNSRTIRRFRTMFTYHLDLDNVIAQEYTVAMFLLN